MKRAVLATLLLTPAVLVSACSPDGSSEAAATSAASTPSAAATADEAAITAAEAALAEAETSESPEAGTGSLSTTSGLLSDAAARQTIATAPRTSALAALAAIEVKGRAPRSGYARDLFGSGWTDTDHNGCDTRNDILGRDLTGETVKPGTHDCVVLAGTLADPYSGRSIAFTRGQATSEAVQIDHVVALSDAWQKGAQGWDVDRRTAFANDPLNLLAVDGPLNMQKGDGDAATWLPPNRSYRCAYVARQVAVKVNYGLWMTSAEKDASATVLSSCPTEPLPAGVVVQLPASPPSPAAEAAAAPTSAPKPVPAPKPTPKTAPRPAPKPAPAPAPSGASYANCAAARAAGAAPLHVGDPGYRKGLDRDGDGIACE